MRAEARRLRLSTVEIPGGVLPLPASRRSRRTLLQFAFAISFVTYLDRVAISAAAPAIRGELGLSAVQMGWVFSAFTIAYAAFEIPSGRLGDVLGPRKVLTRIVIWWSVFTALTGVAWNFASLLVMRFLFGVGEAGAYPNISRSFARWFPARERGRAHGIVFMASRVGGAVAPPLGAVAALHFGWRAAFWVFGAVGIALSLWWWRWFRDDPATHPTTDPSEVADIQSGIAAIQSMLPWRSLLSLNLLIVGLMYACVIYGLYFYLSWLPTYFAEARGFTRTQAATLAGGVLLTGGAATIVGGWLTDRLARSHGLRVGRAIGVVALPLGGLSLIGAAMTPDPLVAALCFCGAAAAGDICLSPSWAICHDIGGQGAGTVPGYMNTFGNIGGAISPLVVGYTLEWWGSWETPLLLGGAVYIVGGLLTLLINPRRPLAVQS
jgi:MFS family permease